MTNTKRATAAAIGMIGALMTTQARAGSRPNTAGTMPQKRDDGVNTRRARIGILGKFFGDWNCALIYDFGGTSDGFGGTGSTGAASPVANVGFLPGGATSGIENAYLSYTGF